MASRVCVDCAGQTTAVIGDTNLFEVVLPAPSMSVPTGTITIRGVTSALSFDGQQPVSVSTMAPGRRELTLTSAPTTPLTGRNGQAWVVGGSICWGCRVVSISGTTVYLADALPAALPTGAISLYFGYWAAELPVQSAPVRNCIIKILYNPVAAVGQQIATLTFQAAYVRQIFDTGLTAAQLRSFFAQSPTAPTSDAGLEPAIAAGLDDLVRHIRVELAEKGLTEDAIPAPSALLPAHRLFAAAHVYALTDRDLHDSLRSEARYAADDAMRHLWVDINGNGSPDGDPMNITGLRSRDFSFALPKPRRRPWPGSL